MSLNDIDDYIKNCPIDRREILAHVHSIIKDALPDSKECIKYGMPTYFQSENLVHFANAKNHIGFYPTPSAIKHFSKELEPYKTSKGAIQFQVSKPIPFDLIREICLWRLNEVQQLRS